MPTNGQQLLKTNLKVVIKHPSKRLEEIPNRHKIIEGIADNLKWNPKVSNLDSRIN